MFGSQNRAWVMQLRYQLSNFKKNDLPAADYFIHMKGFADVMAFAGKPLSDEEILGYVLARLGPDYEPLVAAITSRDDPASLNSFYAYFLSAELRLEQQASSGNIVETSHGGGNGGQYGGHHRGRHGGPDVAVATVVVVAMEAASMVAVAATVAPARCAARSGTTRSGAGTASTMRSNRRNPAHATPTPPTPTNRGTTSTPTGGFDDGSTAGNSGSPRTPARSSSPSAAAEDLPASAARQPATTPSSPDASAATPATSAADAPAASAAPSPPMVPVAAPRHHMQTCTRDATRKELIPKDGTICYDPKQRAFTAEPSSYRSALADTHWRSAMEDEHAALLRNNTWTLVPKPPGTNIIGSRWVFKTKHKPGLSMYLLVYVDDIVLASSSPSASDHLVAALGEDFPVKDLGPLHFFLGIQVTRDPGGMTLCQEQYALDLLKRANMDSCKPVTTPMSVQEKLSADQGTTVNEDDAFTYRSTVGGLQYLTLTRPDSYAVNKVCQYLSKPTTAHWEAVKRICGSSKDRLT
ncbi:hypothetical protein QYE76_055384 [Lolium multiflorum]|uniref:Reverse transcriptase Ty1/copia-type domain-containing protein n=1 Tax=Lolium multiflorum TaxID=4521 RepID=A0AAD8WPE6_LOLMU|nr:hypothetical protein QYE76_055384 [Lolium multiflorum]